jgi:hypothetical protein
MSLINVWLPYHARKSTMVRIHFSKPLPECEGPRLAPFKDMKANVNFVRLLSDIEQNGQSHVFEVSIKGRAYVLKIVSLLCPTPITLLTGSAVQVL